jgi:hypothetical protein
MRRHVPHEAKQQGRRSFLKKRTKKLLPVKASCWIDAHANLQKFLLLFSKRSASLLHEIPASCRAT